LKNAVRVDPGEHGEVAHARNGRKAEVVTLEATA
jgi:hypothetical protein